MIGDTVLGKENFFRIESLLEDVNQTLNDSETLDLQHHRQRAIHDDDARPKLEEARFDLDPVGSDASITWSATLPKTWHSLTVTRKSITKQIETLEAGRSLNHKSQASPANQLKKL